MDPFKPFPIPLVAAGLPLGPGSQPADEAPTIVALPREMVTFQAPPIPEREDFAGRAGALDALHAAHAAIQRHLAGEAPEPIDLGHLGEAERALVNQVLGEGEVAAQVQEPGGQELRAQESVFAGVWRVLRFADGRLVRDTIEVGAIPAAIPEAARQAALRTPAPPTPPTSHPADTMNAPSVLEELRDHQRRWQPDQPAHVINLTLLPLSEGDSRHLDEQVGRGPVVILSRGYGNCRITSSRLPRTWRVTYFNSQDMIILDTLEVAAVPEVACAARQDLEDSAERLAEVLQWVDAA
jgi:hydrogenase-1 operon protein HyaF